MSDLNPASKTVREPYDDESPLDTLSRTLEDLEHRLARMSVAKRDAAGRAARNGQSTRPRLSAIEGGADRSDRSAAILAGEKPGEAFRPSLSSAVSQIALRQKVLNGDLEPAVETPKPEIPVAASVPARRQTARKSRKRQAEPGQVSDVSRELQRLRDELRSDIGNDFAVGMKPRLDQMRQSFEELRQMIGDRAGTDAIKQEIQRLGDGLDTMIEKGVDRATMQNLKSELEAMGELVGQMARDKKARVVKQRLDVAEPAMSEPADAEHQSPRDIKDELERLRASIALLASEDHVRAVEERLDQFEATFSSAPKPIDEAAVSELIKGEMVALREKLEALASEESMRAVEERWGAMEGRFASRDIETKIETMAERVGQIEAALDRLPETLSIAPLEERVQALALSIEALTQRQQDETDADHFGQLEERLDEISRAIVNASTRAPALDMTPIDRIEARLQTLAARVDEVAEGADTAFLTQQIVELSERMEDMANGPKADDLAERIERFSGHLEQLVASTEAASANNDVLEGRLQSLAEQIDEVSHSRVDEDMVQLLESQVGRLSQLIGKGGGAAMSELELDARFGDIERRLETNQEAIVSTARAAADEAVRRMLDSGDLRQSEHVAKLTAGLTALENLSRESGSQSHEFFTAVHTTLTQLVERIGKIENEIAREGHATRQAVAPASNPVEDAVFAAFEEDHDEASPKSSGLRSMLGQMRRTRQAPSAHDVELAGAAHKVVPNVATLHGIDETDEAISDSSDLFASPEANRPLAVGSGVPNVTALLERVRAQQAGRAGENHGEDVGKADFIAAARRAAMAAAAEADNLRAHGDDVDEGRGRLTDLLSRRRKPLMMAMGAVILALMALPLGQALLSSPDGNVGSGEDVVVAADDSAAALPAASVEDATVAQNEPSVATVPNDAPNVAAASSTTASTTNAAPVEQPSTLASAMPDDSGWKGSPTVADQSPYVSPTSLSSSQLGPTNVSASTGLGEARAAPSFGNEPLAGRDPTASAVSAAGTAASAMQVAVIPAMPQSIGTPALAEAVAAGDPKALFEVGLRLMEGRNATPAPEAAAKWFEASATRGFAPAQYSLGTLYEKGNGLARDTSAARDWYLKAASQGNVRAMHNLAVLYATGVDGKSDPKLAADWFEKAAEHGMTDSQYNLGILYARGAGVEQNLVESYKWFGVVAAAGDKDSATKRDEVAKSMTAEQLTEGKAAVDGFKPVARDETANTVDIPAAWSDKATDPVETSSVDMKKAVRNIQAILTKLGYDAGTPDGVAGAKTAEAIKAFQKNAGLKATGNIDEPLIRELLKRKDS